MCTDELCTIKYIEKVKCTFMFTYGSQMALNLLAKIQLFPSSLVFCHLHIYWLDTPVERRVIVNVWEMLHSDLINKQQKQKTQILQNDNVSSCAPKQASSDSAVSCITLILLYSCTNECHIIPASEFMKCFRFSSLRVESKQSCSYKLVTARDQRRLEGGLMANV